MNEPGRMVEGDGRPQGQYHVHIGYVCVMVWDGRPQGQCHSNKKHARFVVEEDGRPQGAPPHVRTTPVPTMPRCPSCPSIVGASGGWLWGGWPLWSPVLHYKARFFLCEWHWCSGCSRFLNVQRAILPEISERCIRGFNPRRPSQPIQHSFSYASNSRYKILPTLSSGNSAI